MGDARERYMKVCLSDEEYRELVFFAANYDLDITTFFSKICRDIIRKDNEVSMPLKHLTTYIGTRFHESDDGFLSCLIADDQFDAALEAMAQVDCNNHQKAEQAKEWLDKTYANYQSELLEDADTKEMAMEKLRMALIGVQALEGINVSA